MAWNDPRAFVGQCEHGIHRGQRSLDAAARINVDERIQLVEVGVARVDHVRDAKVDHRVTVGMRPRNMHRADFVAVQMQGHRVVEGHQWQRCRRGRRLGALDELHRLRDAQPRADVVLGDDDCACLRVVLVAASVVAVPVRVQHEAHRLGTELGEFGVDARGERRVLVVNDEDAVCPDRRPDVATAAVQHVYAPGDLLGPDRRVRFLKLRLGWRHHRRHQGDGCGQSQGHGFPLCATGGAACACSRPSCYHQPLAWRA